MNVNATRKTTTQTAVLLLSSVEQKRLNYPRWGFSVVGVVLLCSAIFGTIEHIWVLLTFAKNKKLRSPTNMFIIGLSICDLCMALFALPLPTAAAFAGYWNSGDAGCQTEAFLAYVFGLTSLYILTAISVDRYIVIAKPLKSKIITKRVATVSLLACLGGGMFWSLLPLFGWNGYGQELPGVSCGLQYRDHSLSNTSYIIAIFVFCFLLPMCIMVFCYYGVYMTIRSINKASSTVTNDRIVMRQARVERKLLKTCIAMVAAFWVCWVPYAIVSFWQSFGNMDSLPLTLTLVPAVAAKFQIVLNPIIYVATNTQFRLAFYQTVPCTSLRMFLLRKETGPSEEQNDDNTDNGNSQVYSLSVAPVNTTTHNNAPSTSTR